ncbi:non-specific lipid-transfer protein 2-like [Actinidia eriantha]|uniref:non-specific lipid-transfer protein 2-like n=1 Tax=Actinidia eriantha TaxID=165200 RepID=UPI002585B84D|nr:non-specific lipid-transfer protein 2-like [Actinidia eriantha]
MKKVSCSVALMTVAVAVVVVLLGQVGLTEGVECNPTELSSCLPAITLPQPPSKICCDKLKEQEPCLCQYLKDPSLGKYVNNPNTKKVATTCGVPIPTNC